MLANAMPLAGLAGLAGLLRLSVEKYFGVFSDFMAFSVH
jgi:hypothetical protein